MTRMTLTLGAALLATSASAQTNAPASSTTEKTGVNSVLGVAPSTQDFVTEAATSDMFEIESSKLALERSEGATKALAQQMVADHEKTTADLKGLVTSGKVKATLPTNPQKYIVGIFVGGRHYRSILKTYLYFFELDSASGNQQLQAVFLS